MEDLEYYKTKMKFPDPADYTKVYVYKEGFVVFSGTVTEFNKATGVGGSAVEKVRDNAALAAARTLYHNDVTRLLTKFKTDLFEDCGVTGHPKAEKCYSLAWEHGHSAGLSEVQMYFQEFSELLK